MPGTITEVFSTTSGCVLGVDTVNTFDLSVFAGLVGLAIFGLGVLLDEVLRGR